MPMKGEKMSAAHRKALSDSMKKYWDNQTPEEKAERIEKFAGARRRPELADLPPQLENPTGYFCGYQKKFRVTHPRILCLVTPEEIRKN